MFVTTTRNNNRNIRSLFQRDVTSIPNVVPYWSNFVDNLNWGNIWNLPYKYLLTNKVREVSFKIIHRYYPAKQYLLRFKLDICVNCSLCGICPETMVHLFWQCPYTITFWKDLSRYITIKLIADFSLFWKNVLFGFHDDQSKKQKEIYLINLLIILGKYHIHKAKFSNSKPSFIAFGKETEQYIKSIYDSRNKKAAKTIQLCSIFNVFIWNSPWLCSCLLFFFLFCINDFICVSYCLYHKDLIKIIKKKKKKKKKKNIERLSL